MRQSKLTAILILASTSFAAQAADLFSIYQQALENDPQYRAAEADYRANQEAKSQGWAPLLPQINLSGSVGETDSDVLSYPGDPTREGETTYENTTYSLTLNQTIYQHEYYVQLRQANAQVARAEADFHNARQELIVRVAEAYFQYLGAVDNLTFARAEKKAVKQQLNQTKQRFNVGLTAITDVHEAQARYDQTNAATISAENLLAVARENLREITGMTYKDIAKLSENQSVAAPQTRQRGSVGRYRAREQP